MSYRLRERHSVLAVWSSRLAVLSVPVLVIAAIGRRRDLLSSTETFAVIALGFTLAALAVVASIVAFEAIWRDGRKGLGPALTGLALGLTVLSLPAAGAWKVVAYPRLTDISTDTDDPPPFVKVLDDRSIDDRPVSTPTSDDADLQHDAYPDIVPRHYAPGPAEVYAAAAMVVADRGWRVLDAHPPDDDDPEGRIEAVAMTPIFGFRQDVAIRIVADGDGALVDMRSAARNGAHDLGADAERIRDFFADLDTALETTGSGAAPGTDQ